MFFRNLLMILFGFLLVISCNKTIESSDLVYNQTDGLFYEKDSTKPFTGTLIKRDEKTNKIITEWNYENGKNNGICKNFYEDGTKKFYGEFKNGIPNGVIKEYNNNGRLHIEENFKNGVLDGEKKEFYENGQLKTVENYKDDFLHGKRETYTEDGVLKIIENYYFDELTSSNFFPNKMN
ncbi:toxin-antitoxin system YwqK family antitoxin [Cetobacterium sp. 2G large]|uniref:toxin-antitoxin system YwqK family antitoxin n=1 Tax=Cetobacterium sp. 2G large TaxID=2759680 RepID=UPI00163C9887|nr:toxin-antitoxin system YwqK family antitoxin [Cetobacterium sp. 2G large]MBC2853648.1 toxin-antitoxin system YwqK family antitoxin [Cetobacterium sp. 2G large]